MLFETVRVRLELELIVNQSSLLYALFYILTNFSPTWIDFINERGRNAAMLIFMGNCKGFRIRIRIRMIIIVTVKCGCEE